LSEVTAQQAWEVYGRAELLHDSSAVEAALDRMSTEIHARLAGSEPVVVCLMNGGVVPFGRLLPRLGFPLQVDYVHATRYGRRLRGGELDWVAGPFVPARGRSVLLVDDILDEGTTIATIEQRYRMDGAREVLTAVLVEKDRPRSTAAKAEFVGLHVPARYVFGCGMDYKGWLRNVPGIYAVSAADEETGPARAGAA
jgi:hypoxanthine phosphoribosyltransferase